MLEEAIAGLLPGIARRPNWHDSGVVHTRMMNGLVATLVIQAIDGAAAAQAQSAPAGTSRSYGRTVVRQEFDGEYIRLLTAGDRVTGEHFASYFGQLLRIKLSRHGLSVHDSEDACQETFRRAFHNLRKQGIEHPERIGAYLNSVCNHVRLELYRSHTHNPSVDVSEIEPMDTTINMEGALIDDEKKKFVHIVLAEMPEIERRILQMVFLEELEREEICMRMNVSREYLRVILHRALQRFKVLANRTSAAAASDRKTETNAT